MSVSGALREQGLNSVDDSRKPTPEHLVGGVSQTDPTMRVELPRSCRDVSRRTRYNLLMNTLLISLIVLVSGFAVVLTALRVQAEDTCSAAHRIYHLGGCAAPVDELH